MYRKGKRVIQNIDNMCHKSCPILTSADKTSFRTLTFQETHERCSVLCCTRHWLQDTRPPPERQGQFPLGKARLYQKVNR